MPESFNLLGTLSAEGPAKLWSLLHLVPAIAPPLYLCVVRRRGRLSLRLVLTVIVPLALLAWWLIDGVLIALRIVKLAGAWYLFEPWWLTINFTFAASMTLTMLYHYLRPQPSRGYQRFVTPSPD